MDKLTKNYFCNKYGFKSAYFPKLNYQLLVELEKYITEKTSLTRSISDELLLEIHLIDKNDRSTVNNILEKHKKSYQCAFVHNPVVEDISASELKEPLLEHLTKILNSLKEEQETLYIFNILIVQDEFFEISIYWNTEEAHEKNLQLQQERTSNYFDDKRAYRLKYNQGEFSYADHHFKKDRLDAFFVDFNNCFQKKIPDIDAKNFEKERTKLYKSLIQTTLESLKEVKWLFSAINTSSDFKYYVHAYDLSSEKQIQIAQETVNAEDIFFKAII